MQKEAATIIFAYHNIKTIILIEMKTIALIEIL